MASLEKPSMGNRFVMVSTPAFYSALGAVCMLTVSISGCGPEDKENATGGTGAGAAAGVGGAGVSGAPPTGGTGGATGGTGGTGAGTGGAAAGTGGGAGVGGNGGASGASAGSGGLGGAPAGGASGAAGMPAGGAGMGGSSGGGAGGSPAGGASGIGGGAGAGNGGSAGTGAMLENFSFFVTSLDAVRRESGSMDGFGGDLGGLEGADAICTRIAESSMPGSGAKGWRAFLSTTTVNAISRIGMGPWYDRLGRLIAMDVEGLLNQRPEGDALIVNDLPNELGQPNRSGTGTGMDDNHDTITASNQMGEWDGGPTCEDWTSAVGGDGPRVGHSWPAGSGMHWIQAHTAPGCVPSVALVQMGAGSGDGIGNGGGYGGWYCFALMP
jgi:hypothetical protein